MRLVLCVRMSWRTFWVVVMVWAMIVNVTGNDPGNHLSKDSKEAAYWHHNSCLFLIYCIIYCIMWWKVGTVGGLSPPKTATSQYTTHSWEGPIASDQWPVHCLANEKVTQEVSTKQEDLEENMGAVTDRERQRCIFLDLIVRKVVALETKHVFHEYQTLKPPFFLQIYGLLQATFGDNGAGMCYTAHRPGRPKPRGHQGSMLWRDSNFSSNAHSTARCHHRGSLIK